MYKKLSKKFISLIITTFLLLSSSIVAFGSIENIPHSNAKVINGDSISISLPLDSEDAEKLSPSESNQYQLEIDMSFNGSEKALASESGIETSAFGKLLINGKEHNYYAHGNLIYNKNNVALGCLAGYINNSTNPSDRILLSIHYDAKTKEMCIPVTLGGEDSQVFIFGSINKDMQDAVKEKIEKDKSSDIGIFNNELKKNEPLHSVAGAYPPADYTTRFVANDYSKGAWLDLFAPLACHPANQGQHDTIVSTKVDRVLFENYVKNSLGRTIIDGASGCNGPINASIFVDFSNSGLSLVDGTQKPPASSTKITIPIIISVSPLSWSTITLTSSSVNLTFSSSGAYTTKATWKLNRIAGFTNQIFSSDALGFYTDFRQKQLYGSRGQITGAISYQIYATSPSYQMIYVDISLSTSANVNIG
jgi:hypothetical protein